MAFSPTFIWTTPSSQPDVDCQYSSSVCATAVKNVCPTLDNLADTDGGDKITTTDGAVEPVELY